MILADKIIDERKKNGWSQEELAEKLGVTRQSVSKWEGAQSVPDLQRILDMSRLFGVSTDYLLKDEAAPPREALMESEYEDGVPRRVVSMEEARRYLSLRAEHGPKVALAVFLCLLGAAILILLSGAAEYRRLPLSTDAAGGLGTVLLLLLVAAAVAIILSCAQRLREFEYLGTEDFETAYGVRGMLLEERGRIREQYGNYNIYGTVLCIVSVIPLIASVIFTEDDFVYVLMTALMLLVIGFGVRFFIIAGANRAAVESLLQEGEFDRAQKAVKRRTSSVNMGYWLIVTAVYLILSFVTETWNRTWIVWAVAGVLYPVVILIANALIKRGE